jgi:hypothetical protein
MVVGGGWWLVVGTCVLARGWCPRSYQYLKYYLDVVRGPLFRVASSLWLHSSLKETLLRTHGSFPIPVSVLEPRLAEVGGPEDPPVAHNALVQAQCEQ